MTLLFPPYLNEGSYDLGDDGPIHRIQQELQKFFPGLSKKIGLKINGQYDQVTGILVAAIQDIANHLLAAFEKPPIDKDGHFGPDTRSIACSHLPDWELDTETLEFFSGGECMYISPGSPEHKRWPPTEESTTVSGSEKLGPEL